MDIYDIAEDAWRTRHVMPMTGYECEYMNVGTSPEDAGDLFRVDVIGLATQYNAFSTNECEAETRTVPVVIYDGMVMMATDPYLCDSETKLVGTFKALKHSPRVEVHDHV